MGIWTPISNFDYVQQYVAPKKGMAVWQMHKI